MPSFSVRQCEMLPELVNKIVPNFIYNRFDL